jgi:hypothetical protein
VVLNCLERQVLAGRRRNPVGGRQFFNVTEAGSGFGAATRRQDDFDGCEPRVRLVVHVALAQQLLGELVNARRHV